MSTVLRPAAQPFFLETSRGKRFCLYHAPSPHTVCVGAILYVPPFGEEMNMSRRMAALQSRDFAAAGYGVLQIDLFGCGDSEGELRDADWETWKQDLMSGTEWLCAHVSPVVTLWGLRLGATLVLDAASNGIVEVSQCILWQPIVTGKTFMTQFLRLNLATGLLTGTKINPREVLERGELVELGGYELPPALVDGIDCIDFSSLRDTSTPLHWFELIPNDQSLVPVTRMNIARAWLRSNVGLRFHAVTGPAFWATKEVTDCPTLIAATTGFLAKEMQ